MSEAAQGQLKQLKDANVKYKKLLQLAKQRIQQQEDELKNLKSEQELRETQQQQQQDQQKQQQQESESKNNRDTSFRRIQSTGTIDTDDAGTINTLGDNNSISIVRVCQRIKDDEHISASASSLLSSSSSAQQTQIIWALIEFENNLNPESLMTIEQQNASNVNRRYKRWNKFMNEIELDDFVRRESGEPIVLPPYSLSSNQSSAIQFKSKEDVGRVTEEFRRFRVRSALAQKQMDVQIRELQDYHVQTTKRRIEGHDVERELEQARSDREHLERLRVEMMEQETQWKKAYDSLFAENTALKSTGSEALLASQWRQRYETCLAEKEKLLQERAKNSSHSVQSNGKNIIVTGGSYEMKYRDLKESFRLYRKKAKEVFQAQQKQHGDILPSQIFNKLTDEQNENSKLSYLKNLMVNYLSSDLAVREHMEMAIGTVLQFTPEDVENIEDRKFELNAKYNWF